MRENTSMTYKKGLTSRLKNKEYRDAFVLSHINNWVPFQIKTLREQKNLTQEDLGKLAAMKQAAISRLENPNYGNFTLKTLKQIASAFDVALSVRFIPFSELVDCELNLSVESLRVNSFEEEPLFRERVEEEVLDTSLIEGLNRCLGGKETELQAWAINKKVTELQAWKERNADNKSQLAKLLSTRQPEEAGTTAIKKVSEGAL